MFVLTEKERKKSSVFKGLNEYLKKKKTWKKHVLLFPLSIRKR